MKERIPPQDLEAEQSVLGSMMLSKDAIAAVTGRLQPEYFYKDAHMHMYNAIVVLMKKGDPVDMVTVSSELKKMNTLDQCGGKPYLIDVLNSVPTATNVDYYANIVLEKALLRRLIDAGSHLLEQSYKDEDDVDQILGNAQRDILDISKENIQNDFVKLGSVVSTVWDNINDTYDSEDGILGVSTGYTDLDDMTSGFQPGDLIILAARPSMGKTALALNFAMNASVGKEDMVAIFSCEMPKEQLALRMLSAEAKVDLGRLRTANIHENEYRGLSQALGRLSESPIYIDDTPSITPLMMRAKCRRLMMEGQLKLIIVDYLQLMRSGKKRVESRYQEVSDIVREVKAFGKELKIPIIALSQLSRDVEKRGGDFPKLSDLRESGEIEQTADLVLFIHRDDYYDKEKVEKHSPTKIVIAKQRNGPTGDVDLVFRKDVGRFEQIIQYQTYSDE